MTNYALIGLTIALIVLATCLFLLPAREPKSAGRHRPTSESSVDATTWLNHDAPRIPFTATEAHLVMQQHLECRTDDCARKTAAFDTLTGAGVIKARKR